MNTLTVGLLTLVVGIIYARVLDYWEHSHQFQGSPNTIVQVIIGMLIIIGGVALAVYTDIVTTAREAFRVLVWYTAAVGLPIFFWYWPSHDRHMREMVSEILEDEDAS